MRWSALSPRQKQLTIAAAGAGVLALIVLLGRRRQPAPAAEQGLPTDTGQPVPGGAAPWGSTFADNGAAAAGLSTELTSGLGAVATGQQQILELLRNPTVVTVPAEAAPAAAVEPPVTNIYLAEPRQAELAAPATPPAQPAPVARPKAKEGYRFVQTKGPRTGQSYNVIQRRGQNFRVYEGGGKPVPAGPSKSKPAPKAKAKPSSPSKRPARTPTPPRRPARRR